MGPGFFVFFQTDDPNEYAGAGHPVIIYETLPEKTVKRVVKKVKQYKEAKRKIDKECIDAIVSSMVDTWSQKDMRAKMELYDISQEVAILSYKKTLERLINDDDLALVLILASI
jgi:ASC-1-like (ASCH) protein